MEQFNGWDIIPMPDKPGLKQIELTINDSVVVSTSPYTQQQQTQEWVGADQWTATFVLPQMTMATLGVWQAWLMQLRGAACVFPLGHPLRRTPLGTISGQPVTSGITLAMSRVIQVSGFTPGLQALAGDHVQILDYLHVIGENVVADDNGNATFKIGPVTRKAIPAGTPLKFDTPQGMFRLADNKRTITTNETRLSSMNTFKCVEAR